MKRAIALLALVPLVGCKSGAKPDAKFEEAWSAAAKATEPAYVEGDLHGAGLLGEIRRAASPSTALRDTQAAEPTILPGPLPDGEVVRVIRQNLGQVKGCYKLAERDGELASGKAIVNMEIDVNGNVDAVTVDAPAFDGSRLPGCVGGQARHWTFPKFTQGPKRFSYPFVFVGG